MKNGLLLTTCALLCGAAALWVWRITSAHAEPLPRLIQDMAEQPGRLKRLPPPPEGAVPFCTPGGEELRQADGGEIYLRCCAACHGAEGTGESYVASQPGMPDVSDLTRTDLSPEELYHTLTSGRGAMPAFGVRLSEHSRRQLLQYITTTLHKS